MIKINLLPPEKRRLKRTPLIVFVPAVVAVVLFVSSIFLAILFIVLIKNRQRELNEKTQKVQVLQNKAKEYDKMEQQINAIDNRLKSIETVVTRDISWSEILIALIEIISKNPKIWVDEINFLDESKAQSAVKKLNPNANARYALLLKCNAAAESEKLGDKATIKINPEIVTKFRQDLVSHPLIKKILPNINPTIEFKLEQVKEFNAATLKFEIILFDVK